MRPRPGTALPFWPRATPAAAAQPPCALAPLPPGAPGPPPGGCLGTGSGTDHRPRRRDKLPPSWVPQPRCPGLGLQAPPPGTARRASSRPLRSPEPRAPAGRPASAPTKPAAPGDRARGGEGRRGAARAPGPGKAPLSGPAGSRGRERGRKSPAPSANASPSPLALARSLCSPRPSMSACPGGSWRGEKRRQRGGNGLTGGSLPYLCPE